MGYIKGVQDQAVARRVADESIVLLKNDGFLPLARTSIRKLAVIGANANRKHAGAGGSSQVRALYEIIDRVMKRSPSPSRNWINEAAAD